MIIIMIKIIAIITKIVNFFLIINLHPLKITMVMLQLQMKLMILILLLEVVNLKNIIKLTVPITTAIIIVIVITLKTIAIIKVVPIKK